MAAMSVIGIDLGNESCYVAVAKAGGIETIANDYSLRATPSYVAFSEKNRILGVAAKNQQVTNMKNTVYGLKRIIGRKFNDKHVQSEMKHLPFNIIEIENGNIGIKVNYLNTEHVFTPQQCLAMLLTKLKDISTNALKTPINDCVMSVPSYFTNNERKALLDSCAIADLNVLRLFNETTATALAYGIYKQDLPNSDEKPRNVVFVDCGHASLQISACAFNKDKLRMITTVSDPNLGGRDFDLVLANYFSDEFQKKYNINAKSNPRAFLRLLAEVEKIKKQMSANSTTLPLNIECFMNDKDVRSEIKRADFEQLSVDLLKRVEATLKQCLVQSELHLDDIYSVEIVGGSTRIPAIKQLIEKVFKKIPSTTLNQDEAVSRGCALQCAMLSPAVRVREFNVKDVQPYSISVAWDINSNCNNMDEDGKCDSSGEVEAFPINHPVPYSKMLTFYRQESFSIWALYNGNIPYPDRNIGTWIVKDIRPSADGKPQKVKVKVRINIHGIMTVSSASLIEAKESIEVNDQQQEQVVENQQVNNEKEQQQNDVNMKEDGAAAAAAATTNATSEVGSSISWTKKLSAWFSGENEKESKKKQIVKSIDLPIEALTYGFSQVEINQFTEQECKMIAADRQEKERADARNALEEYVYELRGKLTSDDDLALYIIDNDRQILIQQLDNMENWLYEEGEECNRQIYQDKLNELKLKGEPIQQRKIEHELRPIVIEDFAKSLQMCMKAMEQIKAKDAKYAHLSDDDVKKIDQNFQQSYQWLEQTRSKCTSIQKHQIPTITVAQIRQEKSSFENAILPILNKPPPKQPSPPKEDKPPTSGDDTNKQQQQQQQQQENMEWSAN